MCSGCEDGAGGNCSCTCKDEWLEYDNPYAEAPDYSDAEEDTWTWVCRECNCMILYDRKEAKQ